MTAAANPNGIVLVVSAPSGGGKGTILKRVLANDSRLRHTVSATTRAPRDGEVDGVQYRFVDRATFKQWIDEGQFVEWASVHDEMYGTLHEELDRILAEGGDAVLELDVQGMRSIRALRPETKTIFIEPPSMDVLEQRLRKRGGLTEDALRVRLRNARAEIAAKNEYDRVIVNDDLDRAVSEFKSAVAQFRAAAS
jgi:guanylate kinase